jgi:uncharacterized protein YoxC
MLILTILTGMAFLVLLLVLGWALGKIAHALEGITGSLEKIAMGVRAIERETAPWGRRGDNAQRVFRSPGGRL